MEVCWLGFEEPTKRCIIFYIWSRCSVNKVDNCQDTLAPILIGCVRLNLKATSHLENMLVFMLYSPFVGECMRSSFGDGSHGEGQCIGMHRR